MMYLSEYHCANCRQVADMMGAIFAWNNSAEGHDYWREVQMKLYAYADHSDRRGEAKGRRDTD